MPVVIHTADGRKHMVEDTLEEVIAKLERGTLVEMSIAGKKRTLVNPAHVTSVEDSPRARVVSFE